MNALHHRFSFLQLLSRNTADAISTKVGVAHLNAAQATEVFVAIFLPFRDQISVRNLLLQTVFVELPRNGLALPKQVIDVPRALVVDLEDWPQAFGAPLAFMRLGFRLSHLAFQLLQCRLNKLPAVRWWLSSGAPYLGHDGKCSK